MKLDLITCALGVLIVAGVDAHFRQAASVEIPQTPVATVVNSPPAGCQPAAVVEAADVAAGDELVDLAIDAVAAADVLADWAEPELPWETWSEAARPIAVLVGEPGPEWDDPAVVEAASAYRLVQVDAEHAAAWKVAAPALVFCDSRWNVIERTAAPTDVTDVAELVELLSRPHASRLKPQAPQVRHAPTETVYRSIFDAAGAGASDDGSGCATGRCPPKRARVRVR